MNRADAVVLLALVEGEAAAADGPVEVVGVTEADAVAQLVLDHVGRNLHTGAVELVADLDQRVRLSARGEAGQAAAATDVVDGDVRITAAAAALHREPELQDVVSCDRNVECCAQGREVVEARRRVDADDVDRVGVDQVERAVLSKVVLVPDAGHLARGLEVDHRILSDHDGAIGEHLDLLLGVARELEVLDDLLGLGELLLIDSGIVHSGRTTRGEKRRDNQCSLHQPYIAGIQPPDALCAALPRTGNRLKRLRVIL